MDLVFSRTKRIPANRFGRECSLCSSRHGVPIECSARGCKAAYHTTCAIRGKLKMQAIFGKKYRGGIRLRSYCKEHTPTSQLENGMPEQSDAIDASGVKEIDMTNLADDRLQESNEELDHFWKYVDINEVQKTISEAHYERDNSELTVHLSGDPKSISKKQSTSKPLLKKQTDFSSKPKIKQSTKQPNAPKNTLSVHKDVDPLVIDLIYRYWILLRTANNGQSLIKFSPSALKEREFEQRKSIMKLRIELERVRNLSYMIGKREKLKSSWLKTHQSIIKRTLSIIDEMNPVIESPQMIEPATQIDRNNQSSTSNDQIGSQSQISGSTNLYHHTNHTNSKKSLHLTQHLQPSNNMFDESDQLINDLLTCDQIYEVSNNSSHMSNLNNLSYQERSTLEGRRTLSLVRRINRQLKYMSHESSFLPNPYAKSYLLPKRSDSPVGASGSTINTSSSCKQEPGTKLLKYR